MSMEQRIINACARAAHEANKSYCEAIGDNSQLSWEDAPDWQRKSAMNGVMGALRGNTPEQSHESWLAEKRADGRRYGEVKVPVAKTHPCFVPYAELSEDQRGKDALFLCVVSAMATALGWKP
jgi:hypothetical protein